MSSTPATTASPLDRPTSASAGHLVVRAPNWVGDLVMATPVLEAARLAVESGDGPWSRLSIVLRGHLAAVVEGGALEPYLVRLEKGRGEADVLAELAPDAALLLTSSVGAAWRARKAGIPLRAGASLHGRGLLLTHRIVPPARAGRRVPIPTAHLLRDLAGLVGLHPSDLHPVLAASPSDDERASQLRAAAGFAPDEPFILCCPGAAFGAAKLWPPPRFAQALEELHRRHGWRAIVTGGPGEERLMDAVCAAAPSASSLSAEPRDLGSLKALVRDARLLLVGDSGPRWYAAAFDTPCVSVMGPNFPELTATSLELCEVVRVEGLACSPCLERVCPLDHHACMVDLPSAAVVDAAGRVLARA